MVKGKFKKSPTRYTNGHYSRGSYSKEQFVLSAGGLSTPYTDCVLQHYTPYIECDST